VQNLVLLDAFHAGEAWTEERRPQTEAILRKRPADLAAWLDGRDHLEGRPAFGRALEAQLRPFRENAPA
jgi:glutathione S-transferase